MTGPVYIEDAEPSDILEVYVKDIEVSAAYGVSSAASGGVLPETDFLEGDMQVVLFDNERETALFTESVGVSLEQDMVATVPSRIL